MRYIDVLERIEEGRFSVKQAEKAILKRANRQSKRLAKKFSIKVQADDTNFKFSFLRIGFVTGLLSMSKPFLKFIPINEISEDDLEVEGNMGREEIMLIVEMARAFLKDFKKLPPIKIVSVKTNDAIVLIETK